MKQGPQLNAWSLSHQNTREVPTDFSWSAHITFQEWGYHSSNYWKCCQLLAHSWGFPKELLLREGDADPEVTSSSLSVSKHQVQYKSAIPLSQFGTMLKGVLIQNSLCYWQKPVTMVQFNSSLPSPFPFSSTEISPYTSFAITYRQLFMPVCFQGTLCKIETISKLEEMYEEFRASETPGKPIIRAS